jgi:hypothetical protein
MGFFLEKKKQTFIRSSGHNFVGNIPCFTASVQKQQQRIEILFKNHQHLNFPKRCIISTNLYTTSQCEVRQKVQVKMKIKSRSRLHEKLFAKQEKAIKKTSIHQASSPYTQLQEKRWVKQCLFSSTTRRATYDDYCFLIFLRHCQRLMCHTQKEGKINNRKVFFILMSHYGICEAASLSVFEPLLCSIFSVV